MTLLPLGARIRTSLEPESQVGSQGVEPDGKCQGRGVTEGPQQRGMTSERRALVYQQRGSATPPGDAEYDLPTRRRRALASGSCRQGVPWLHGAGAGCLPGQQGTGADSRSGPPPGRRSAHVRPQVAAGTVQQQPDAPSPGPAVRDQRSGDFPVRIWGEPTEGADPGPPGPGLGRQTLRPAGRVSTRARRGSTVLHGGAAASVIASSPRQTLQVSRWPGAAAKDSGPACPGDEHPTHRQGVGIRAGTVRRDLQQIESGDHPPEPTRIPKGRNRKQKG